MADYDKTVFGEDKPADAGFDAGVFNQPGVSVEDVSEKAKPRNAAYEKGRSYNSSRQGLAAAVNGPLMGLGDEILGAIQAPIAALITGNSIPEEYRIARDTFRGMQDQRKEEAPWTTGITQAMVSAPLMVGKLPSAAKHITSSGVVPNLVRSGVSGFEYGLVNGLGESTAEDTIGQGWDALKGGAFGLGGGMILNGIGQAGKGVWNNVAARVSDSSAGQYARQKIAEAFARDARGDTFTSGDSNPVNQALARFNKLGEEARVVDAGGQSTRQLLDTMATLPGRTKQAAESAIRDRQAGRASRLIDSAEENLGTQGQRLNQNLKSWMQQREQASGPLYDQLRQISIAPSNTLQATIQTAEKYGLLSDAAKIAGLNQRPFSLTTSVPQTNGITNTTTQNRWGLGDMDHVKQAIDAKIATEINPKTGKLTTMGAAYQNLKKALTNELDNITTDQKTGVSLYKSARDAFAGPSAIMDAANAGRTSLTKTAADIENIVQDMSASELQGFRIGAFEALREKLGRQSGQTEVMKMWRDSATREKLQAVFGNEANFRQFASNVAAEARMTGLESVGRGSQTAARQFGAGDLDLPALQQTGNAFVNAKAGNVPGALASAASAWNRVQTPERTRDQIGKILLQRGPTGGSQIESLRNIINAINAQNALMAQGSGLIGSQLAPRMQVPTGLLGN